MGKSDQDDLNIAGNVKRIDDLEAFRKEFEGEKLYEKIADAIKKSKTVEDEVKKVAWTTIREKIVWTILGGVGVIFIDLLLRVIPHILAAISGSGHQ
jgi:hypothetical protein